MIVWLPKESWHEGVPGIHRRNEQDKRELKNRLYVIIQHILKLKCIGGRVAADNARGWKNSARREQRALAALLGEHPGLKPDLTDTFVDEVYRAAVANVQVDYPNVRFPRTRQISLEEIVGDELIAGLKN